MSSTYRFGGPMRVVVAGAGLVGSTTARFLSLEQHDIVLIDRDEAILAPLADQLDILTITGSATNPDVLRQAGVEKADLFIAATNVDEVNIVACFMAKQLGAARTVARLRDTEARNPLVVTSGHEHARVVRTKTLGIDHVITPEALTAEEIRQVVHRSFALAVEEFGGGSVELTEIRVREHPTQGMPLRQFRFPKPAVLAAILRKDELIIPHGDDFLLPGDRVFIITKPDSIVAIAATLGVTDHEVNQVTIIGGGRIGLLVARSLQKAGVRVTVIEKSPERARALSSQLDGVMIVQGEGTDVAFLKEEGVGRADGFVATTGRDELNILTALLARRTGARRTVVVVNKPEYANLIEDLGIDAAINPLQITANAILRFVRRGTVISVARLAGDGAEALELLVPVGFRDAGRSLAQIDLPRQMIMGAVVRDGKAIIPTGDTTLEEGDRLVIVSKPALVPTLERYFSSR